MGTREVWITDSIFNVLASGLARRYKVGIAMEFEIWPKVGETLKSYES